MDKLGLQKLFLSLQNMHLCEFHPPPCYGQKGFIIESREKCLELAEVLIKANRKEYVIMATVISKYTKHTVPKTPFIFNTFADI